MHNHNLWFWRGPGVRSHIRYTTIKTSTPTVIRVFDADSSPSSSLWKRTQTKSSQSWLLFRNLQLYWSVVDCLAYPEMCSQTPFVGYHSLKLVILTVPILISFGPSTKIFGNLRCGSPPIWAHSPILISNRYPLVYEIRSSNLQHQYPLASVGHYSESFSYLK